MSVEPLTPAGVEAAAAEGEAAVNAFGNTPLMEAIKAGDMTKAHDYLALDLAAKKDVDTVDNFGCTALHYAARKGHLPILESLIHAGASLTARTKNGKKPIDEARRAGQDVVVFLQRTALAAENGRPFRPHPPPLSKPRPPGTAASPLSRRTLPPLSSRTQAARDNGDAAALDGLSSEEASFPTLTTQRSSPPRAAPKQLASPKTAQSSRTARPVSQSEAFKTNSTLETLDLFENNIGAEGAKHLSEPFERKRKQGRSRSGSPQGRLGNRIGTMQKLEPTAEMGVAEQLREIAGHVEQPVGEREVVLCGACTTSPRC